MRQIVFEREMNDQKITILTLGYELDKNGLPMINENHIEAIACYLKYKVASRERFNQFKSLKLTGFNYRFVEDLKKEWIAAKRNARATDADTDEAHTRMLSEILNNPLTGDGLLRIG